MKSLTKKNRVYCISSVHNSLSYTKKLIYCLKKQKNISIKTIIVDDGSSDGTPDFLEKDKDIKSISGNGNLWWTAGINLAVIEALRTAKTGDYILTINNDCIFDDNFVHSLVDVSKNNHRSIVGSLEFDNDDRQVLKSGVVKIDWEKGRFYESITIDDIKNDDKYFVGSDTLQTKGTLIPVEVFQKDGLFDQKHFPHYASDYEFFIRAKTAGFNLLVANAAVYCDSKRTGITDNKKTHTINETIKLAFSRKSQINIIDHLNLIRFCCPNNRKIKNYVLLLKKALYFVSRTYPISLIREYLYEK